MKTFYYLIVFLSFLCCSCNHYYYLPNDGTMLMLEEKGDIKISGGTNNEITVVQAGFSPIKHLAVGANYLNVKVIGNGTNFSSPSLGTVVNPEGKGFLLNGSVGGYYFRKSKQPLSESLFANVNNTRTRGILFDLHAGYGRGRVNNTYSSSGSSKFDFQKYFIQPGIHFQGRIMSFSTVLKFSHLNYFKGEAIGNIPPQDIVEIYSVEATNPFNLLEPTFRYHIGFRYGTFYMSTTFLETLNDSSSGKFKTSQASVGIIVDIDEIINAASQKNIEKEKVEKKEPTKRKKKRKKKRKRRR